MIHEPSREQQGPCGSGCCRWVCRSTGCRPAWAARGGWLGPDARTRLGRTAMLWPWNSASVWSRLVSRTLPEPVRSTKPSAGPGLISPTTRCASTKPEEWCSACGRRSAGMVRLASSSPTTFARHKRSVPCWPRQASGWQHRPAGRRRRLGRHDRSFRRPGRLRMGSRPQPWVGPPGRRHGSDLASIHRSAGAGAVMWPSRGAGSGANREWGCDWGAAPGGAVLRNRLAAFARSGDPRVVRKSGVDVGEFAGRAQAAGSALIRVSAAM